MVTVQPQPLLLHVTGSLLAHGRQRRECELNAKLKAGAFGLECELRESEQVLISSYISSYSVLACSPEPSRERVVSWGWWLGSGGCGADDSTIGVRGGGGGEAE